LSLKEVEQITRLGHTTIYKRIKLGDFPKQLHLTNRKVGWLYDEVIAWVNRKAKERFEQL